MSLCVICNAVSEKKCSLCASVYYCSREHQKQDWKRHKTHCLPYRLEENALLGRHLVAGRRIAAGEQVLLEKPLVSGPQQATAPVCLGCFALLSDLSSIECERCGWPMCSPQCARNPMHRAECHITAHFRQSKVKIQNFQMIHPNYECLTVLRCLWLKTDRPSAWEKLNKLQSHCDERKLTDKYQRDRSTVAQFIHRFFKFVEFSEHDILRVLGIINTNGHEVPISGNDFVSIYDTASYLEHNCQANCAKGFSAAGELVIRAARVIEPGEHLSICYSDPLWGTQTRRLYLQQTKFFSCVCKRCMDPTELDTHFSSLRCVNGDCKGFVIPKNPLENSEWKCIACHVITSPEDAEAITSHANAVLSSTDKTDLSELRKYIRTFERVLHPNHHLITDAKLAVTQVLESGVEFLSDEQLSLKLSYCKHLSTLVTRLVPAENRCRGVLLFGLHAALAEAGRRKSNRGEFDSADLKNNLLECKEILSEAYQQLRHEPDILPEGQVAKQAKSNLQDMERILQTLHANMGDSF